MDVLCVLLPIFVCRNLQTSWQDKLAVFLLLGLGLMYGFVPSSRGLFTLIHGSTAGAAIARTVLYRFLSQDPTCKHSRL